MKNFSKLSLFSFATLFLLALCISPIAANATSSIPPTKASFTDCVDDESLIKITIDFGRQSRDCKGFGICSISIEIELSDILGLFMRTNTGGLVLNVEKANMTREQMKTYFGKGTFLVEEDYEVPAEALVGTDIRAYTILKGNYKVVDNNDSYQIVLH